MERVPPLSEINRTRARASRGNFNYARRCRRQGTQTVSRLKASEARTVFKDSLSPLMEPLGLRSGGAGESEAAEAAAVRERRSRSSEQTPRRDKDPRTLRILITFFIPWMKL